MHGRDKRELIFTRTVKVSIWTFHQSPKALVDFSLEMHGSGLDSYLTTFLSIILP